MVKETKGNSIDYSGLEVPTSQHLVLFCPLQGAIDVISRKWALLIINEIGNHKKIRFSELRSELREITAKSLSNTLEDLISNELIIREAFREIPPRVEYSLTCDGQGLHQAIIPLLQWAASRKGAVVTECSCKAKPEILHIKKQKKSR